tara:strand:- start:563 stop:1093 length:531 start_codon:yes stop_codon:yes gene_type:complete
MKQKILLVIIPVLLFFNGCSTMDIEKLSKTEPQFDLFKYFSGNTKAWGIFQGRGGELKRQFTVDINGKIEGDEITLVEDFVYADGENSQRIWKIKKLPNNEYIGTAADVVGKAYGKSIGSAFNWKYTMVLPYKNSTVEVDFNDWMFLQPDNILINKAEVRKFGLTMGEVTITFVKK